MCTEAINKFLCLQMDITEMDCNFKKKNGQLFFLAVRWCLGEIA